MEEDLVPMDKKWNLVGATGRSPLRVLFMREFSEISEHTLLLFSQRLLQALEMEDLHREISDFFTHILKDDQVLFFFIDEEGELRKSIHLGFIQSSEDLRPPPSVMEICLKQGFLLWSAQEIQKEDWALQIPHNHQFLMLPLLLSTKRLGFMVLSRPAGQFENQEFLESAVTLMALAYDRALLHARIKELSMTDELTGLYNRRYFQEMIRKEWKRAARFARPLSLLVIDADHFKEFNDEKGHLEGDFALKELASLLVSHVREVDTVARYGGEEFVIILGDTTHRDALFVAEKLRYLVETKMTRFALKSGFTFTVSIGVSAFPDFVSNEEDLFRTADQALYLAKMQGRNRVVSYQACTAAQTFSAHQSK